MVDGFGRGGVSKITKESTRIELELFSVDAAVEAEGMNWKYLCVFVGVLC